MPLTFNGNTPSAVTYNGNSVSEVTYNGVTVWQASNDTVIVMTVNSADEIWLAMTESTPGAVTIDWGDGSPTEQLDDIWAGGHTYATSGDKTIRISCAEGATWCPGGAEGGTWSYFDPDDKTRLKSIRAGSGFRMSGTVSAYGTFDSFSNLTEALFPAETDGFYGQDFRNCSSLSHLRIAAPTPTFNGTNGAFSGTALLNSAGVLGSQANYEYGFTGVMPGACFRDATGLTAADPPEGITEIGVYTYGGCTNLGSIVLPSTLTDIKRNAFNGCTSLLSIVCKATTPPTVANANAFNNVPATCAIYVPSGSVAAYQAANIWSSRAAYIQAIP